MSLTRTFSIAAVTSLLSAAFSSREVTVTDLAAAGAAAVIVQLTFNGGKRVDS